METEPTQQRYVIFFKGRDGNYGGHAVVHLIDAPTPTEALWRYLWTAVDTEIVRHPDGSLEHDGVRYSHPLEYIEAGFQRYGEWQMRLLLEPTSEELCTEAFCGHDEVGVEIVMAECRGKLGKKRARAFVWYLNEGVLVTFYRKGKPVQIDVRKRYLWTYNGEQTTIRVWKGDYVDLMESLYLNAY